MNRSLKTLDSYKYLVFSGGGVRGVAYIGFINQLHKYRPNFFQQIIGYAGASIGAILSFFLICGYTTPLDIKSQMKNCQKFLIGNISLSSLHSSTVSLCQRSKLYEYLSDLLFVNFGIRSMTFQEFFEKTNKEFVVVVTEMSSQVNKVIYCCHKTTPNFPIIPILVASSAIPLVFEPVQYNNNIYVDGGMLDNFPMHLFPKKLTLGIHLDGFEYGEPTETKLTYILRILKMNVTTREHKKLYNLFKTHHQIVNVKCSVNSFSFILSPQHIETLIYEGSNAFKSFFLSSKIEHEQDVGLFIFYGVLIIILCLFHFRGVDIIYQLIIDMFSS